MALVVGGPDGTPVRVTAKGRQQIDGVERTGEAVTSIENGRAFFVNTATTANTLTKTTTEGAVLYLENDDNDRFLVVSGIFLYANGSTVWRLVKNATLGTASDNNVETPVNLNFESGKSATVTAHSWNETNNGIGGLSGGTTINVYGQGEGQVSLPIDESFVLGTDDNLVIYGTAISASKEVAAGIRFHFILRSEVTESAG